MKGNYVFIKEKSTRTMYLLERNQLSQSPHVDHPMIASIFELSCLTLPCKQKGVHTL